MRRRRRGVSFSLDYCFRPLGVGSNSPTKGDKEAEEGVAAGSL